MNLDREHACDGKRPYRTRASATAAMRTRTARGHKRLNTYKCPWCGRHHIGHLPYDHPEPTP